MQIGCLFIHLGAGSKLQISYTRSRTDTHNWWELIGTNTTTRWDPPCDSRLTVHLLNLSLAWEVHTCSRRWHRWGRARNPLNIGSCQIGQPQDRSRMDGWMDKHVLNRDVHVKRGKSGSPCLHESRDIIPMNDCWSVFVGVWTTWASCSVTFQHQALADWYVAPVSDPT